MLIETVDGAKSLDLSDLIVAIEVVAMEPQRSLDMVNKEEQSVNAGARREVVKETAAAGATESVREGASQEAAAVANMAHETRVDPGPGKIAKNAAVQAEE